MLYIHLCNLCIINNIILHFLIVIKDFYKIKTICTRLHYLFILKSVIKILNLVSLLAITFNSIKYEIFLVFNFFFVENVKQFWLQKRKLSGSQKSQCSINTPIPRFTR